MLKMSIKPAVVLAAVLVWTGLCGRAFAGIADLTLSPEDRILVLAPHPDDEVLGTGGIIQKAVAMKLPVKVAFLTYGDSNQWSFLLYRRHPVIMPGAVEKMGLVRRDEALAATSILGVPLTDVVFLGYPDFGTMNMWYSRWNDRPPYRSILTRVTQVPYQGALRPGASYKGEEVVKDLRTVLSSFKPTKIFVSHPADHNGDHLALYLYTRVALWDEGMQEKVQLLPYLVHYLGWPKPLGYRPNLMLTPPVFLKDIMNWTQYRLEPQELELKKAALAAHRSQYKSTPRYLTAFIKPNELFGDFPRIRLRTDETSPLFSVKRKFLPRGGVNALNEKERQAFVGVEWKFISWEKDNIIISIDLSKPLAHNVEAFLYVFGYSPQTPFKQMPKISVRLGMKSYSVYNQAKRINQDSVKIERTATEVKIWVPHKLLHHPDRILTCALTYLGNVPLDNASWMAVETY